MLLLGLEFTDTNDINCYFEKKDLTKVVIDFFLEVEKAKAREFAQTKLLQAQFMKKFIIKYQIEKITLRNRSYTFSAYSNEFFTEGTLVPKEEYKKNLNKYLHLALDDNDTTRPKQNKGNSSKPEDSSTLTDDPEPEKNPNQNDDPPPWNNPNSNNDPKPENKNAANNDKSNSIDNDKKKKDQKLPLFLSSSLQ